MPHKLTALEISEVSLVDNPANAETNPRTGKRIPRAVIALYKRDTESEKENHMSTLEQVLKSATATRDQIADAVEAEAITIQKRAGCSLEAATAAAWAAHPEAYEAYEAAPIGKPKRAERRAIRITRSEAILDELSRKRVRKTGEQYCIAASRVLEENPGLYAAYERELAAGATFTVPEPERGEVAKLDDGDECPECGGETEAGDKFCANCGGELAKKAKR